jgi:AcrR family transcriptional regulator
LSDMATSPKGEQTRTAIIEAALRLFAENGYEATTMRAIAREVGVATGNAYYYYASKEDSTAPIAARLIRLAGLPGLRSVPRQMMSALDEVRRP